MKIFIIIIIMFFYCKITLLSYQSNNNSLLENSILNHLYKIGKIEQKVDTINKSNISFKFVNKYSTKDSTLILACILYYTDNSLELTMDFILAERECDTFRIINDEFISKEYWDNLALDTSRNIKLQDNNFFMKWSDSLLCKLNLVINESLNDLQIFKLFYEFKRIQQAKNYLKYTFLRNVSECNKPLYTKFLREVVPSIKNKFAKNTLIPIEYIIKLKNNKIKFKCKNHCSNQEVYLNGNKVSLIVESNQFNNIWKEILPNYENANYYEDINNEKLIIFSRSNFTTNLGFRVNIIDIIDLKNKECYNFIIDLNDEKLMNEYGYIFGY